MIPLLFATWKEIYRKKVFLVTLLLTLGLLGLVALVSRLIADNVSHNIANIGAFNVYMQGTGIFALSLYGANFSVAYLSIFTAAGTISTEIENGLLLAILPRPVPRWRIYLGKWLGYSLWSMSYTTVLFWALAIIIHVNMHFPLIWHVMAGAFLVFLLIPIILVSLTMLGSTYLPTLGNGILVILIYGLGVFGDLLDRANLGGPLTTPVTKVGFLTNLLMPAQGVYQRVTYDMVGGIGDSLFQFGVKFLGRSFLPLIPSNLFVAYAAGYAVVLLLWGMARFSRRDI